MLCTACSMRWSRRLGSRSPRSTCTSRACACPTATDRTTGSSCGGMIFGSERIAGTRRAGGPPSRTEQPVQPAPVTGARFRELLYAAQAWLDRHHEIVNALNVFPVPGRRHGHQHAADDEVGLPGDARRTARRPWAKRPSAAAHGALMGARGNSGVILSQILRGMSKTPGRRSRPHRATLSRPRWPKAAASPTRASTSRSKARS